MGSYSSLIRQSIALAAMGIVLICAAPTDAKPWIGALLAIALIFFIAISVTRHRQVMRLANEIDEVLHSGRKVDFADYRESDIALLSNETAKMVGRLARTHDQLEKERNALSDALADVSHQIRTPLTAASLMIPMIEHANSDRERIQRARELEVMLDRVSWLVTSLLKIAKFDSGAMRLESTRVDCGELVRSAIMPLETSLDIHDIELDLHIDECASFSGDIMWSAEAIENIVKNCIEHTPSGGKITVRATEDAIATRISIEDTGAGISEEDLPHIFERFYRGRETTDRPNMEESGESAQSLAQPEGFGIGLALAQALICAQGGSVRASSKNGSGAKFDIVFPKMIV